MTLSLAAAALITLLAVAGLAVVAVWCVAGRGGEGAER